MIRILLQVAVVILALTLLTVICTTIIVLSFRALHLL